jgi:altronate dehydratase
VPIIKGTTNPTTCDCVSDVMEFCIDPAGDESRVQRSARLYQEVLEVASGKMTRAEALKIGMYVDIWQQDVTQ